MDLLPDAPEGEVLSFDTLASTGNQHLASNQFPEAVSVYTRALQLQADPGLFHNLGVAYARLGQVPEAVAQFRKSLEIRNDAGETWRNLGVAYTQLRQIDDAIAAFHKALQFEPGSAQIHHDLANVYAETGQPDQAIKTFGQAIKLNADFGPAHHALGRVYGKLGKHAEAAPHFEQAIRCLPDSADAHHDLGIACLELSRYDDAAMHFRRALKFTPKAPHLYSSLGAALGELSRDEEAIAAYRQAIGIAPEAVEFHNNYGNALRTMGRLTEAEEQFEIANQLKPNDAGILNNWGIVHVYSGRVHEAIRCYDQSLEFSPDFASAHLNRAFAYLTMADFERGWPDYEWRWQEKHVNRRTYAQPEWDGQPLEGKTILVYAEQGLGDTVQFIRYAKLVKERGGFVIFEAPPALLALLSDYDGVDQLVPVGKPLPPFETHIPLLSLPKVLGTNLTNIPAPTSYLIPERRRVERWREPVRKVPGFRVGIAWQGNKAFRADRHRSIPLKYFLVLESIPGVTFLSLQKGAGTEQIAPLKDTFTLRELPADTDRDGAFVDTAAILQHLDLFITSDSAIAHIAGAIGVPTWLVIPFAADWRWLLDREDNPWYPTMQVFRQRKFGDWEEVFIRVRAALAERVGVTDELRSQDESAAHHERGTELLREENWAEGESELRKAIELRPDRRDSRQNLGVALARQGKFEEAIREFSAYVDRNPRAPDGYSNLGLACLDAGRWKDAEKYFVEAIRITPENPELHNNLGVARLRQDQLDPAVVAFRRALECREDYGAAHTNLATILRRQKNAGEALAHFRRACELAQNQYSECLDVGLCLIELQQLEEAETFLRRAESFTPDSPNIHNNLGILLADLHRMEEAEKHLARAVELVPEHAETHRNYALTLLASGKWERGWQEYEWRLRAPGGWPSHLPPKWDGSPLGERTLLVWSEQGNGDAINFVRYALAIKERFGGRVVFACHPTLVTLFRNGTRGLDGVVSNAEPLPPADVAIGTISLPAIFGTTLESVLDTVPYIEADPALTAPWKQHLANIQGFRVGIVWQGSPGYGGDCYRSTQLRQFMSLAAIPGVQLISLQKGFGVEQLATCIGDFCPVDLGRQIDEGGTAYLDSAAVMQHLDLVVSVDTSLAHLAGAMGVPTFLVLSTCSDWRWVRERDDTPWYPTMRLFRQQKRGEWAEVFERVGVAIRDALRARQPRTSVKTEVGFGELVDKVTILQIKLERIEDASKIVNVNQELNVLRADYEGLIERVPAIQVEAEELKRINETLWEIEDHIRDCERTQDFGEEFIRLARSVYQTNDRRAAVKRSINSLSGSSIIEEKSYQVY